MRLRERLHILVVHDLSTSRGLIAQALGALGIVNIRHASNGIGALTVLGTHPVHLVLSDYNMPGMDGLGLLRQAARQSRHKSGRFHSHHWAR